MSGRERVRQRRRAPSSEEEENDMRSSPSPSRSPPPPRRQRNRQAAGPGNDKDKKGEKKVELLAEAPLSTKMRSLRVRTASTLLMVGGFCLILYLGHVVTCALVFFIQVRCYWLRWRPCRPYGAPLAVSPLTEICTGASIFSVRFPHCRRLPTRARSASWCTSCSPSPPTRAPRRSSRASACSSGEQQGSPLTSAHPSPPPPSSDPSASPRATHLRLHAAPTHPWDRPKSPPTGTSSSARRSSATFRCSSTISSRSSLRTSGSLGSSARPRGRPVSLVLLNRVCRGPGSRALHACESSTRVAGAHGRVAYV